MFDLDEELKKNPELKKDDIENIKLWIAKQPHLPDVPGKLCSTFFFGKISVRVSFLKQILI